MSKPLKIFVTYSHTNTAEKDKLITRLAVMKRQGLISIWHDNEILGGDKWREEIFCTNLPNSDILLYLVSAESLASENCNKELAIALDEKIRVIPIILEDCDWKNDQLSDFQAFPDKGKPINEWKPESKGWQNVVDGIRKVIKGMQTESKSSPAITPEEIETLAFLAFHRGNFMMILGQIDEALKDYSRTIELSPKDAAAYTNRGVAYGEKGEFDLAIKTTSQHLKSIQILLMPIIISVTLMLKKTKLNVQSKTLIKRFNSNKTFPMPIITEAMLSVKETRLTMLSMTLPKP